MINSPFVRKPVSVRSVMFQVLLALVPGIVAYVTSGKLPDGAVVAQSVTADAGWTLENRSGAARRTPLFGWAQDELWQRAVPRKGSLWRHLRESGLTPPSDLSCLQEILNRADYITPYRLLELLMISTRR